jgi:hydroxypyruvate reductase
MAAFDLLKLTPLPTHLMNELQSLYQVHDHGHLSDPSVLGRVTAMIGSTDIIVDAKLLATYPKVRLVCVVGESYQNVDLDALIAKNVMLTYTPGVANADVADLAMGLMLGVVRRIPHADRFVRNADWVEGDYPLSRRVNGARMGLVGAKPLILEIAQRAFGFKMSMAYFDYVNDAQLSNQFNMQYFSDLKEMAQNLDVLVLCAQDAVTYKELVNKTIIEALGANAYVVNVGDAGIFEQSALIAALQQRKLAGAAIDVFSGEPKVAAEWRVMQNAVLTPHIGASTDAAKKAMSALALENLKAFFEGQSPSSMAPELAP